VTQETGEEGVKKGKTGKSHKGKLPISREIFLQKKAGPKRGGIEGLGAKKEKSGKQ